MDNADQASAVAIMEVGTTLSTFLFGISTLQVTEVAIYTFCILTESYY